MKIFATIMITIVFGNVGWIQADMPTVNMYSATDGYFVGSLKLWDHVEDSRVMILRKPFQFIAQHPFISIALYIRSKSPQEAFFDPDPQNHCDVRYRDSDQTFFHGKQSELRFTDSFEGYMSPCTKCVKPLDAKYISFVMFTHDPTKRNPTVIACSKIPPGHTSGFEGLENATFFFSVNNDAFHDPYANDPSESPGTADFPLNKREAQTYLYSAEDNSYIGYVGYKTKSCNSVSARAVINADLGDKKLYGMIYPEEYVQSKCNTFGYGLMRPHADGDDEELTFPIKSEYRADGTTGMILKFTQYGLTLFKPGFESNIMNRILIIYTTVDDLPKPLMCGKIRHVEEDNNEIAIDNFLTWAPCGHKAWWPQYNESSLFIDG